MTINTDVKDKKTKSISDNIVSVSSSAFKKPSKQILKLAMKRLTD